MKISITPIILLAVALVASGCVSLLVRDLLYRAAFSRRRPRNSL